MAFGDRSIDQPQADWERLAEQLPAIACVHFDHPFDHLDPVHGYFQRAQYREHTLANLRIDVECALAGHASQIGQAEGPAVLLAVVARLERQELLEPPLDHLDRKSTRLNSSHLGIS